MMEKGLVAELDSFHLRHNSPLLTADNQQNHNQYTRGMFQCIGFKEFHEYLILDTTQRHSPHGQLLLQQGITSIAPRLHYLHFCIHHPGFVPPSCFINLCGAMVSGFKLSVYVQG
mgnify:FL=1